MPTGGIEDSLIGLVLKRAQDIGEREKPRMIEEEAGKANRLEDNVQNSSKMPYSKATLKVLGSVDEITQGGVLAGLPDVAMIIGTF